MVFVVVDRPRHERVWGAAAKSQREEREEPKQKQRKQREGLTEKNLEHQGVEVLSMEC